MKWFSATVKILGQLLFLYGLLGWIYGILFQFIYPQWLTGPLSHLTPGLRVDVFAIASFFLSILGFLLWRFTIELTTNARARPDTG
jgi:hypothetical protein